MSMKEDPEIEALRRDARIYGGDTAGGDLNDDEPAGTPHGRPYGKSENFGSPGGDEPPAGTDPGRGVASDARERA